VTTNAASSEIDGADAGLVFTPIPQFTLTAGVPWLHATYDRFEGAVFQIPAGGPACRCGNMLATGDVSGNDLTDAPRFTIGSTATYRDDFSIGQLELAASLYYSDGYFIAVANRIDRMPAKRWRCGPSLRLAGTGLTVLPGERIWSIPNTSKHRLPPTTVMA
jgi:hypothetical protein